MNTGKPLAIAVDGGGTRCRLALVFTRGPATRVELGATNVSTDFDGALNELQRGLAMLSEQSGIGPDTLAALPAYLGLAGVVSPGLADRLRAALPFARAQIEDDRPAALRGALGHDHGALAHCGTGSFFAAQEPGGRRIVGGWGSILGDHASAHWLGVQALALALETVDGLRAPTPLTQALLADHDGPGGIVRFARQARPAQMGALARQVTEQAALDDATAQELLRLGAGQIATILPRLGWRAGQRLCLTGGLAPHYAPHLPDPMRAALSEPRGEPIEGAIALARAMPENRHD